MAEHGRYLALGQLGQGGMATVHRVTDTTRGADVALKRLEITDLAESRKKRAQGLFEREFHTLAQLAHPRIIEVYDYGIDEVGPYYTMELLDGADLKLQSPMPWRRACALIRDVASSLAIVHARGLLHRDVTPSNVRCTEDGRAKLIDFGAMCSMGVATDLVGTPPFVPPEALQHGALDGRTDLFALGGTLYYVMTGRHAYPARTMRQLRDVWRSPPVSLDQVDSQIPSALNQLVLQMLSLSAVGRPASAAIVFERLTGIAELPRDEVIDVARAYLVAPSLVGRDEVIAQGRRRFARALRGTGNTLIVSGAPGVGRSRMLDALLLEAKLLGAEVMRADAGDARAGEFGAMQRLVDTLLKVRPELAEHEATETFKWFVERLDVPLASEDLTVGRTALIAAISGWLTSAALRCPLVLAVDDAQDIDAASLACLAAIAGRLKRHRMCVLLSMDAQASGDAAHTLSILRAHALTLPIGPLGEQDSARMFASIFGNVPNLQVLAGVLYRSTAGDPSLNMAAAHRLVDAGVVRYEGGGWILPASAGALEAALPRDESMPARLATLSAEARQVATVRALDVEGVLELADLVRVCEPLSSADVHRAFDQLLAAGVVVTQGAGYRLARPEFAREIAGALPAEQAVALHDRFVTVLGRGTQLSLARAHHQLLAGRADAACDTLLSVDNRDLGARSRSLELMESVIEAAERAGTAAGKVSRLHVRATLLAFDQTFHERVSVHGRRALTDLAVQCGLVDYAALAELPEADRLKQALERAMARHDAHQVKEDAPFHPLEALQSLSIVCIEVASAAWSLVDGELCRLIPSLEPLLPLSPAIGVVKRIVAALDAQVHGRTFEALDAFRKLDADLLVEQAGMEVRVRTRLWRVVRAYRQGAEALMGCEGVLARIEETQGYDSKRAEGERLSYYLAMGDVDAAEQARRRMELFQVQEGFTRRDPSYWLNEVALQMVCLDVQGLQHSLETARQLVVARPHWAFRVRLSEALHLAARGALEEATDKLRSLLAELTANHPDYCMTATGLINLEIDLGRFEQAAALGKEAVAALRGINLAVPACAYTGYALTKLGHHEEAAHYFELAREELDARQMRGVLRGQFHEWAARAALVRGDKAGFRDHAALCADQYRAGHNPLLTARYDNLMQLARHEDVTLSSGLEHAAQFSVRTSVSNLVAQLQTELSQATDDSGRYERALRMLMDRFGSPAGFLYLSTHEGLKHVASTGELSESFSIDSKIVTYWESETANEGTQTASAVDDEANDAAESAQVIRVGRWLLRPFLLAETTDGRSSASGVVVLAESDDAPLEISWHALEAAARVMREQSQVVCTDLA